MPVRLAGPNEALPAEHPREARALQAQEPVQAP